MSHFTRYRANVRNGSQSRGPKTAETKAKSAQNATTHGLACPLHGIAMRSAILANESVDRAQILLDRYLRQYQPESDLEMELVEDLAVTRWRILRATAIETGLFDAATPAARDTVAKQFEQPDEMLVTTAAFRDLAEDKSLALLHRYEGNLRRQYDRVAKNLREMQSARSPQMGQPFPNSAPKQTQPLTDKTPEAPIEPAPAETTPPAGVAPAGLKRPPARLKAMLAPLSVRRRFHARRPPRPSVPRGVPQDAPRPKVAQRDFGARDKAA